MSEELKNDVPIKDLLGEYESEIEVWGQKTEKMIDENEKLRKKAKQMKNLEDRNKMNQSFRR